MEDSSNHTREQSQRNTERPAGGIPYHPYTPQKTTGTQNNPVGTPYSSSHTVHTTFTPPTSTPPSGSNTATQNPPRRDKMGDDMKLPTFKGTGAEDPEQHWSYVKLYGPLNKFKMIILNLSIKMLSHEKGIMDMVLDQ